MTTEKRPAPGDARSAGILLSLLPAAGVVYFGFNGGGFFPGAVGVAALVVIQLTALRVLLADNPFEGLGLGAAVPAAAIALFALWELASAGWSDAHARALLEFDRALLYAALFVLFAAFAGSKERLRWMLRALAVALVIVCGAAFVTRVLPDVWEVAPNVSNDRLSYPLTYWNALGVMAAIAMVLCVHLASRARGPVAPRVLGAAALPMLAVVLFFTFSRGAIGACIIGVLVYLAVARPRGLPSGLIAVVPTATVAVAVAYRADLLATDNPTTPAATHQGHHVFTVVLVCVLAAAIARLALTRLDLRVARIDLRGRIPRWAVVAAATIAVAGVTGTAAAYDAPGWIHRQYDTFIEGKGITSRGDFRSRLTDVSNNNRTNHWNVAFDAFARHRFEGTGAGTYQMEWDRDRPLTFTVQDAHGLYFEVVGELGIVGLVLLVLAIGSILVGFALRARGSDRPLYGALLAMGIVWAVHAGVDWDWEMPATTAWLFAAGGAALARPAANRAAGRPLDQGTRIAIAVGLVVAAAAPALIAISQSRLRDSALAFHAGNCPTAISKALSSISTLSVRPEPYEVIGYCQLRAGHGQQAAEAMAKAVDRDPGFWEYRYGLAVARAAAGLDPRPAIRAAAERNPREPIVRQTLRAFDTSDPTLWARRADAARTRMLQSGLLQLPFKR
jgi:O-antigen ligase